MFTWVGLFLTQVAFVVWHRPLWHRRLGVIGTAVDVLVVALGVPAAIVACRLGGDHLPPGVTRTHFLAVALMDLAAFALLAGSALALRRRPDFHKRLMRLANMPPLVAALTRLVGFLHLGMGATPLRNLLLLTFIVVDTVRTRRLHTAYVAGATCLIATDVGASALVGTAARAGFVRALTA